MLAELPSSAGYPELDNAEALMDEAHVLYERCLTQNTTEPLRRFIESQLAVQPPRIQLLREVADDLHQRLIVLREQYFEARDRLLYIIHQRFDLDMTPLIAPKPEIYHQLPMDELINAICLQKPLSPDDEARLRRILKVAHAIANQVFNDAQVTDQLHRMLEDWLTALNTQSARRAGTGPLSHPGERIH